MFAIHGRDREVHSIEKSLLMVHQGIGAVLLFEGPAGTGKSVLLRHVREEARAHGIDVLHARGGEFEQGFAWGVVGQLFARWLDLDATRHSTSDARTGPADRMQSDLTMLPTATTNLHQATHR